MPNAFALPLAGSLIDVRGSPFFGRQYFVEFLDENGELIRSFDSRIERDPLQLVFDVETTFGGNVSFMELSLYGLNKDSVGQIAESKRISLQAGYPDAFGVIFEGRIANITTPREGVERRTTVYCWSGLAEQQSRLCEVSFAPGANYSDIVDFVATDYLQQEPQYIGFDDAFRESMGQADRGYVHTLPHKALLNKLAYENRFEWMVDNEKCILMRRGASRQGDQFLISPFTGLVGGVSLTFLGADFEMKLNPKIQIGDRVKVDAESTTINFSGIYFLSLPVEKTTIGDGEFVVKAIRRSGNFYGNNSWKSALTCWRENETGLSESGVPLVN